MYLYRGIFMPEPEKLSADEEKILQKSFSVQVASQRFHRYEHMRGLDSNFEDKESYRRFKILRALISELRNYCVNCGSEK